jgi:UDP-N-acetylmuramoyl-tripeptide--D-alanyl-D-alanine ligase
VVRVALADEQAEFDPALPQAERVGSLDPAGDTLTLAEGPVLRLPLEGRHNARNFLLAVAVAQELGVAPQQLDDLVVELPGGRSRRQTLAGVEILDETYNASTESMLAALDLLAQHPRGRRYAVLGTMLEQGEQSVALHRSVGERAGALAAAGRLDGLVIVDDGAEGVAMEEGAAGRLPSLSRVATAAAAVEPLLAWLQPGDGVLLKASRGVALEQVLTLLKEGLGAD